jgi:2-haloacid dehalogenase
MQIYLELPPFDDVPDGLERLRSLGAGMYAFSNGVPADLERLLDHAGLGSLLDGIVSVHDLETFKPDPSVYHHFAKKTGSGIADCCLVSSNGFDVCGAVSAGMPAIWLQRDPSVQFDHWEFQPTRVVSGFDEIADHVRNE